MVAVPTSGKIGRFFGDTPTSGSIFDSRNLASRIHNPDFLSLYLSQLSFADKRFYKDDFEGDALNGDLWVTTGDTGTTVFAMQATNVSGESIIQADSATDDNEFVSFYGHCNLSGDKNAGMAIRWRTDTIALTCFEFGFSDPLSDYTLPAINDIDTPSITNGAITVAVLAFDAAQTLDTFALVMDGNTTYATTSVDTGWLPTVDQWYTTIIQLQGDSVWTATWNTNDAANPVLQLGTNISRAGVVEGGTLVEPRFTFGNRTSNDVTVDLDFVACWSDR